MTIKRTDFVRSFWIRASDTGDRLQVNEFIEIIASCLPW